MNKYIVSAVVILGSFMSFAQQDPHYTQYMYNMNVINPAYAGSKENLAIGLLYRKQWVEIEDAPTTATLSGHSPVGKNVGLGLSVISDKIGPVEENNVYGDFSYTLNLGEQHKLAFGLKTGLTFHKVGLYDRIGNGHVPDANDPAFSENLSKSYFNIGTGLFFYSDTYYLALSVPNMLKSKHLDYRSASGQDWKFGSETQHYFFTGGYVFDLSSSVKFKPFFMVKSAFKAPTSLDLSTNFLWKEKFEFGATYRLDDSFGAMINYMVNPNIRIGYAYDHIVSDLKVTTPASHEIILLFDVNFPKKVSRSPRYF